MPWYLGAGFTLISGGVGLAVCTAAWYFACRGPRELTWEVCLHLTMLGALLGLLGGWLRSRALASLTGRATDGQPIGEDPDMLTRGTPPAEEACLQALSLTAPGRGSLAAEGIGLLAAAALGVASRSWTPPALMYGALTAAEQLAYLTWLRRQPR